MDGTKTQAAPKSNNKNNSKNNSNNNNNHHNNNSNNNALRVVDALIHEEKFLRTVKERKGWIDK